MTWSASPYDIDFSDPTIGSGMHVVHFKAWSNNGGCFVDSTVWVNYNTSAIQNIDTGYPNTNGVQTSYGLKYDNPSGGEWGWEQDAGVTGSPTGCSDIVVSPPEQVQSCSTAGTTDPISTSYIDSPNGRKFIFYFNNGWTGERWHIDLGSTGQQYTGYTNFVYDTTVNIIDPSPLWAAEFDLNQTFNINNTGPKVTSLYGIQCDYASGYWDYSQNGGWASTKIPCNSSILSAGAHHLQLGYFRDASGNITYRYIYLDGTVWNFSASAAPLSLHSWAPGLLINFQLDNRGDTYAKGNVNAWLSNLTIWAW